MTMAVECGSSFQRMWSAAGETCWEREGHQRRSLWNWFAFCASPEQETRSFPKRLGSHWRDCQESGRETCQTHAITCWPIWGNWGWSSKCGYDILLITYLWHRSCRSIFHITLTENREWSLNNLFVQIVTVWKIFRNISGNNPVVSSNKS